MATAHPGASELLSTLSRRGFDVLYLTARPEWLLPRTREWLALRGFPPGVVHTTTGPTGFVGDAAEAFKTDVLRQLRATLGTAPSVAFGNMPSDVRAYRTAGIDARRAFFFRLAVARAQGTRHDDYRAITPQVLRATAVSCIAP
jgi:phosphatidate phosphatase PAH1